MKNKLILLATTLLALANPVLAQGRRRSLQLTRIAGQRHTSRSASLLAFAASARGKQPLPQPSPWHEIPEPSQQSASCSSSASC